MVFEIIWSDSAVRQLRKLDRSVARRIFEKVGDMRENPHRFVRKLANSLRRVGPVLAEDLDEEGGVHVPAGDDYDHRRLQGPVMARPRREGRRPRRLRDHLRLESEPTHRRPDLWVRDEKASLEVTLQ